MDKNKDQGFPRDLLKQSDSSRNAYFRSYTVAHPKLREANEELSDAIREAIPGSLILVCGPTGAGKTTLRLRTEQRITNDMLKELEADPGRFAVVGIDAISPNSGNFNWKEFYKSVLKKLDEPCINYKINPSARKGADRGYGRLVTNPLTAGTELREAAEEAIKNRWPAALLVDEAQHLAKMSSGRKLQDQLDSIKSLASSTEIPIVLIGTYELLALRNLSAQLSRRSVDVHFRRYRAEHNDERKAFKNVLWSFQNHLPLHDQPDLIGEWDYFYERSVGCIGVLKVWLTRALTKALKDGGKVLAHKHLEKSALSVSQCEKILGEATEGEAMLDDSREDRARLRSSMGLEALFTKSTDNGHDESAETEQKLSAPKRPRRPGERNPKRDPLEMISNLNNERLSIYESWNIDMPSVSARSRLYNLQPIGLGTGGAESLTSYIARLATAHSLTPAVLLGRTLTSVMDKRYWLQDGAHPGSRRSPLGNLFGEYAKAINGIGIIAQDWVTALQNLTLRRDLNFLTMLPWADVFTHRNLLRPSRTWCPSCYHDWRLDDQQIYEPLLWTFRDLDVCTKHRRRLISQCQYCDHKIPWLGRCAQPGYFSKCSEWLGTSPDDFSNNTPILDHELEWQIWIGKNLEELIIAARRLPSPPKERTAQSISCCINQASDGVMNRFARLIGKRKNTVWGWQHGQTQIPIDDLLRICNRVGISLVDFLYANAFVLDDIDLIQTPTAVSGVKAIGRSPRHLDPKATNDALLTILDQQTPISMKEVATRIDLNKRLLYKHFPDLCKAISTRHKEHRRKERQRDHKVIADKINKTRMSLHNMGLYPSRRRVAASMKSKDRNHSIIDKRTKIENLTLAA